MNTEILRETEIEDEILDVFNRICQDKLTLILWQNNEKDRLLTQAIIKSLDVKNRRAELGLADKNQTFDLTDKSSTFFREASTKLLFKTPIKVVSKKMAEFELPKSVKLADRRITPRTLFEVNTDGDNGAPCSLMVYSKANKSNNNFDVSLYDLSERGAGIKLRPQITKHFDLGEVVKLSSVNGKEISPPLEGVIMYLKSYEDKKNLHASKFYRLGVKFNNPLTI